MRIRRIFSNNRLALLAYLAGKARNNESKIGTLEELSDELGVSRTSLREQLEVARLLGFVEIKPRMGISLKPYSLKPAVRQSVGYAI